MLSIVGHLLFFAGAFLIGVAMADPRHTPSKQALFRAIVTHSYGGYVGLGLVAAAVVLGIIASL